MSLIDGRTWMEHLPEGECWALVASTPVGRVAVVVEGHPEVFPVNCAVDDQSVVFRTDPGTKLRALSDAAVVCFEADGFDLDERSGWSVVVKGRAEEVTAPGDVARLSTLPLQLWSVGAKAHWIRVVPTEVTGRRIPPAGGGQDRSRRS